MKSIPYKGYILYVKMHICSQTIPVIRKPTPLIRSWASEDRDFNYHPFSYNLFLFLLTFMLSIQTIKWKFLKILFYFLYHHFPFPSSFSFSSKGPCKEHIFQLNQRVIEEKLHLHKIHIVMDEIPHTKREREKFISGKVWMNWTSNKTSMMQ